MIGEKTMNLYARQVANNPGILILIIFIFTSIAIILSLVYNDIPSFKDPLLGFNSKGTPISSKIQAYKHLKEETSWNGALTFYPNENILSSAVNLSVRSVVEIDDTPLLSSAADFDNVSDSDEIKNLSMPFPSLELDEKTEFDESDIVSEDDAGKIIYMYEKTHPPSDFMYEDDVGLDRQNGGSKFFLTNPRREYAHVILRSVNDENLFTLENMISICTMDEQKLRNSSHFREICEETAVGEDCSKSWSLPNYVALLGNKSSCYDIDETDIHSTLELLKFCSSFYYNLKLSHDCDTEPAMCRDVPVRCARFNAVYIILHFLADVNFMNPRSESSVANPKMSYTTIFLPCAQSSESLAYYKDLEKKKLSDERTEVVAMELGLKYTLFSECLLHDTIYVALAGLVIFVVLSMYSSVLISIMTMLAITFSLGLSYFIYTFVYQIKFFPFINLLTIIIIIGIGVDDACVYYRIFSCAKSEKSNTSLIKCVRDTLQHACVTMFVTSFTTCVAFFASVVSNITAVKCFSIFSGTAVIANFIFTISWLPASVILAEKFEHCFLFLIPSLGWHPPNFYERISQFVSTHLLTLTDILNGLPHIIKRYRYIFILIFSSLAASGAFVVFCYPKLRIPKSREFQIFSSSHPFEVYSFLKDEFFFEKATENFSRLPIRIIFGVEPVDNGDYFSPVDRGSIAFDPEFDLSDPQSQEWLLNLCLDLRNQSFYQPQSGPQIYNCFLESFKQWMERKCTDRFSMRDRRPCCESSKFPFEKSVFDVCIKEAVAMSKTGYNLNFVPQHEGPWFSKSTGDIVAISVQYESNYAYSNSYEELFRFESAVESWLSKMMETAPQGMKNSFFTSDLAFFDLQRSLSEGTLIAIGVAIGVSFLAVLISTFNLIISILAIVTVSCVIIVTIAVLVLLGWKLNVLECTSISIAIGLAVDLTLHYAVAYKMSSEKDRGSSVHFAVSRVGSPVAIASLTTFLAGSLMFFSIILAYRQIGKFMVILSTVSWSYATFFFLALCYVLGPENGNLQWKYPSFNFAWFKSSTSVEKPTYALSESNLSSSSSSYQPNQLPVSEIHELEPLTNINHAETSKNKRKKFSHHFTRARSDSCSSLSRDPQFSDQVLGSASRKISLPSVDVMLHIDHIPIDVTDGTSSSTLICGEDEMEDRTIVRSNIQSNEDADTFNIL